MANLLLGAATNLNYEQLKYWAKSFREVNKEDDIVLLVFNMDEESKTKLRDIGVNVIEQQILLTNGMPIHTLRFIHFKNFLVGNKEKYEGSHVLITDTRDVIFQTNPFSDEYGLHVNSITITSEYISYENEDWGKQNYLDTFGQYYYSEIKNKEIYNVGVIHASYYDMILMCQNIFLMSMYNTRHNPICDQAVFNYLIYNTPLSYLVYSRSNIYLAAHLGVLMDPTKIEKFKPFLTIEDHKMPVWENNQILSNNNIVPIVHQWDRVLELKTYYIEKYKD
jgi:hypothetical protein